MTRSNGSRFSFGRSRNDDRQNGRRRIFRFKVLGIRKLTATSRIGAVVGGRAAVVGRRCSSFCSRPRTRRNHRRRRPRFHYRGGRRRRRRRRRRIRSADRSTDDCHRCRYRFHGYGTSRAPVEWFPRLSHRRRRRRNVRRTSRTFPRDALS